MHSISSRLGVIVLLATAGLFAACGGSSSSDSSSTGTTTDTSTSSTVPGDVVISSITASVTAADASVSKGTKAVTGDPESKSYTDKKEAMQALIAGSGECAFTLSMPTVTQPACYGPTVVFCNHPNATTSDPDCTIPQNGNKGTIDDSSLPTGDLGLWSASEGSNNEACAAAQMNYLIDNVASRVDTIVSLFGTLACAGKKAGTALPEVDKSVDMSTVMKDKMNIGGLTITSATLERLSNDSSGNSVYKSTLAVSMSFPGGTTSTGTLTLKHIPTAADNSTYKGKLTMSMSNSREQGGNCGQITTEQGTVTAGTILYEKTSATAIKYEVKYAEFCGASTNPFDSNNNISAADKASATNKDGWGNNWHYGVFSLNPTDGTGSVAFAWQAGANDGYSRVLNGTTTAVAAGGATGTAYFGFGPDVAATSGVGSITGFFCNWAGPGNVKQIGSNVAPPTLAAQRQGLLRAKGSTVFSSVASELAITFAPTNSCDATGTFKYAASSDMTAALPDSDSTAYSKEVTADNNHRNSNTVTNNLIPLSAVSFTVPTPPSDV